MPSGLFKSVAATVFSTIRNLDGNTYVVRTFSLPDFRDPITGVETAGANESVGCIREEYTESQFQNEQIRVGDFNLLAEVDLFSVVDPKTNGCTVSVDGKECQIINAEKDAAEAVWTLQVRSL